MPGWLDDAQRLCPSRSNTSTTLDAFLRYVTAITPLPNDDALDHGVGPLGHDVAPVRLPGLRGARRDDAAFRRALRRLQEQTSVDHGAERLARRRRRVTTVSSTLPVLQELIEVDEPQVVRLACPPSSRAPASGRRATSVPNGPHVVASFSFSALVNCRNSSDVLDADRCPSGGTAPGRCTDPSGSSGSDRRTPSRRAASRAPASCRESRAAARLPRVDLHQVQRRVLVAGAIGAVRQQLAVRRRRDPLDRRQAGRIDRGRIDQHASSRPCSPRASR